MTTHDSENIRSVQPSQQADSVLSGTRRLLSLDALRGFTILLMLLVNNFGREDSTPRQLLHAGWEGGVHLADFVFPWFLFCLGVAIPYSVASFRRRQMPAWRYDLRVLRRALLLVLLGMVVSSAEAGRPVYTIGVLQLIASAYVVGALLYDLPVHRRLFTAALLLLCYWVAIKLMHVPGLGTGTFAEGKNFISYVNRTYLSTVGLEGLPLAVPASALVLIATVVGDMTRTEASGASKAIALLATGTALILVGDVWSLSLGFNKPLWTPSFVLLTSGAASLLLGVLYYLVDFRGFERWTFPLVVFGSNAILAYVVPIVFKQLVLRPVHMAWPRFLFQFMCEDRALIVSDRQPAACRRLPARLSDLHWRLITQR